MSGDFVRSGLQNEIYELNCIIDDFRVGAASCQTVSGPSDDTELCQTINLLQSKIIHLNFVDNIQEFLVNDDRDYRQRVHSFCRDGTARFIVEKKAVKAGIVANVSKSVIQRASDDGLKKELLHKLKLLFTLARELESLLETLRELSAARLQKELLVKEELSHFSSVVDKMREANYPPEDVLINLGNRIKKINQMRQLINLFLLGPGAHLNGKWLDVLYRSRNNVELCEFFS